MFRDYDLRSLRKKRDEAEAVMTLKKTAFSKAVAHSRFVKQQLASWERVSALLDATMDPVEKDHCQLLLLEYPLEDELRKEATDARDKVLAAEAEYCIAQRIYSKAAEKAKQQKTFNTWVRLHFGVAIAKEIRRRFGSIELTCKFNEAANKLNVYFGGRGYPLGPGHAHWVFDRHGKLVYRRDPVRT